MTLLCSTEPLRKEQKGNVVLFFFRSLADAQDDRVKKCKKTSLRASIVGLNDTSVAIYHCLSRINKPKEDCRVAPLLARTIFYLLCCGAAHLAKSGRNSRNRLTALHKQKSPFVKGGFRGNVSIDCGKTVFRERQETTNRSSLVCERKTRLELATPTLARLEPKLKINELGLIFIIGVVNICSYRHKHTANFVNKQGPYSRSRISVVAILDCFDLSVGRVKNFPT